MTSHAQLRSHLQTRLAPRLRRNDTLCAAAPNCTDMDRLSATARCWRTQPFALRLGTEGTAFPAISRCWTP